MRGHITRKTDDDHAGLSGPNFADSDLEAIADSDSQTSPTTDSDDDTPTDPVMGDASPDTDDDDSTDSEELPCGHEAIDPAEAPERPFRVTCGECGDSWVVRDE